MKNESTRNFFARNPKSRRKIDIISLNLDRESYAFFKYIEESETEKLLGEDHDFAFIERPAFDNLLSLSQSNDFKEIKRVISENDEFFEWENFYTESLEDDYFIDMVKIHTERKLFQLLYNEKYSLADGYTELGMEACATYVSREIFDSIAEGIKKKGYKSFEEEE